MYADDEACMDAIMTNVEGEATEWVIALHDKGTPKLGDHDAFLGELRARFGGTMQNQ